MTGAMPDAYVDHVNWDKSDNRWSNLRQATPAQNMWNRRAPQTSATGCKGVERILDRYRARIKANGRRHDLGCYDTLEQASRAYQDAAKRYHGDFAAA
ncbi:HNH endonuclease [Aureimonas altamirensis]|uniref:HNH endonuclease n=1 Tax=Aureimonas altamirensis TaxID=370622 RepID=UPI003B977823